MTEVLLHVVDERFPIAGTFTISRGSRTEIRVVTVTLSDGDATGRGECVPYARYGETVEGVIAAIEAVRQDLRNGLDRQALQSAMPAGAARNAIDCALWDIEAKRAGVPAWTLAGLPRPVQLDTAYTLSIATPEAMRKVAEKNDHRPLLKIKLGSPDNAAQDVARVEAVRAGAPHSTLIVDANEGWTIAQYHELAPEFVRLGVAMVEQPLPAKDDDALRGIARLLPVCADESCHDRSSLAHLAGKYDAVNIKLDKTGGLTEALQLRQDAERAGFDIMVGCMLGTSLAMAPAFLVAQNARYVDLDGPLLLARDRETPIHYEGSLMEPPPASLWG
ncbi:N-acetyl-D-Glu racemase DgcA [Pseudochelatococcus contaminans]|uniref:Dipeptide epimerase n=1 Tax=Pseudochelatococcus contaminans TaxID=1538103 RepID=A0A7W5Z7F1_9HYPH|nr:N-acetyl-D-Glu racemase DgcA [Pseudochelatococcus contaminans]MBB3811364.1 L-alanine-DL-glutamate epimerase-like enolase superfamily enzyme [Pseudochelatococcus contaminans]